MPTSKKYHQLLKESNKLRVSPSLASRMVEPQTTSSQSISSDIARKKESTEAQVRLDGLVDYYEMRKGWGQFLKVCLGIILAFNISLVALVGIGYFKFTDEWFLRIVLTTNLADIIGLVYLVVKFLFSNQIEKDPKVEKGNTN